MKFAAEGTVVPFHRPHKASGPTGAPALIEIPDRKPSARKSRRKTVLLTKLSGEAGPAPIVKVPKGTPRPQQTIPLEVRIARLTDASSGPDGFWKWLGSRGVGNGYPQISWRDEETGKRTTRPVHRVLMQLNLGRKLQPHEHVLHDRGAPKDDVNPRHLRVGTAAENAQDAFADGRLGRRLKPAEVLKICQLRNKHNVDVASIAFRFDLCHRTVIDVLKGRTHSKLTGIIFKPAKTGRPRRAVVPAAINLLHTTSHAGRAVHLTA